MGAQTNSRLVGLLLVALSLVLLLAPLDSAARRRQSGRRSDNDIIHYQDNPANPKWEEPDDPNTPPGHRKFGPFWAGCGRLRAYQPDGWPNEWPRRDDTFELPLTPLLEYGTRQSDGGKSRMASLGNNLVANTEIPSHVSIVTLTKSGFATRCGGVLIADRLVLTTRRCLNFTIKVEVSSSRTERINYEYMHHLFVFASWRTMMPLKPRIDWAAEGKVAHVENLCVSKADQPPKDKWDVQWAILRLHEPLCFSDSVYSACLPRYPFWDPDEVIPPDEKTQRMIVQVGNGNYSTEHNKHLRASIHRNIFKCKDEFDELEVCAALQMPNNHSWDPMCWRDAGAGGYILDSVTDLGPRDRLTVASIVGHMPYADEFNHTCEVVETKEEATYKSMDVSEALEEGKLKEAIETCGQGIYGYPEKKLKRITYI